jgi:hypothetical protein
VYLLWYFWQKIDMLGWVNGLSKKANMVSTRNMIKNKAGTVYKSLTVEVVPYVYRAGDDTPYRRQQTKPQDPTGSRRSPRLAALRAKSGAPMQSYKSIIQTRAQKMKEHQLYLDAMFTNINKFYTTYGYEPRQFSETDDDEVAMGQFIKALRDSYACDNLGGQSGVDLVMSRLPWFKFDEAKAVTQWSKRSFKASDVAFVAFLALGLPVLFLASQYLVNACFVNDQCPSWATQTYVNVNHFASVTGSQLYSAASQLSSATTSMTGHFLNNDYA